jgi:ATP-dependent helicase/nuclease subunit B
LIIDSLMSNSKATVRWDADQYYANDKTQEAGRYFRKKQLAAQDETLTWTFDYFSTEKRNIHLLGVPLNVGQARYAGVLLNPEAGPITDFDDTAVVIPDEKLLMPVLHSLPAVTDTINVTMGYPLKGTPVD